MASPKTELSETCPAPVELAQLVLAVGCKDPRQHLHFTLESYFSDV